MSARRIAACVIAASITFACTREELELPQAPSAFAGFDAFVTIGSPVALDASLSADPDGDALSFSWKIAAAPEGSSASIVDPSARVTSIVPDVRGTWVIALTASDGRLASRDLVAFTATEPPAPNAARPSLSIAPRSQNAILSGAPIVLTASSTGAQAYAMRVPAGADEAELELEVAGREISFVAPRPGEYWIAAALSNASSSSTPAIAVVAVFEDGAMRPRAELLAPETASINERVLFDGRMSTAGAALTWRLLADPSRGGDSLADVATGCPTGQCRLLLPSRLGIYVVGLEADGGATAVHALEVIE